MHLDLLAGTEFPIEVGATVPAELPYRLRLDAGVGWMPEPYVEVVNDIVIELGGWDEPTGDLITSVLKDSLVLDFRAGWRPFPKEGFFFMGGASYVTLGAAATTEELLVALTGAELPRNGVFLDNRGYVATSSLTMLSVEFGWDIVVKDHWVIRPSLGGRFTVNATASMEPDFDARADELYETLGDEAEAWLIENEEAWVHAPYVGVKVGYRLP